MAIQRRRRPGNQLSRSGLKNENIDRQILVLHKAMVEKMLRLPDLIDNVQVKINERYQQGKMHHGAYLTWLSILEHYDEPVIFMQSVLEDTPRMRKLRRRTPFVGILTGQERQEALLKFACGEGDVGAIL